VTVGRHQPFTRPHNAKGVINGIRIDRRRDRDLYRDLGTGKPVVLIHGSPLSGDSWDKQANFLAEHGLRVIDYGSARLQPLGTAVAGYDYDTLASDLNKLMEELDLRGVTLVGFSMGGGEVVRYLSRYGTSRVSKAVLVSAVTPYLLKTSDNPDGVDPKVFEEIEENLRKDRPAFLNEFGPKFMDDLSFTTPSRSRFWSGHNPWHLWARFARRYRLRSPGRRPIFVRR
jgi:pimeloyl-ACP methyl ester carboxylesterase